MDKLSCLCIDRDGEFIGIALKKLYNEKKINIRYMIPYIYQENYIVEQYW